MILFLTGLPKLILTPKKGLMVTENSLMYRLAMCYITYPIIIKKNKVLIKDLSNPSYLKFKDVYYFLEIRGIKLFPIKCTYTINGRVILSIC